MIGRTYLGRYRVEAALGRSNPGTGRWVFSTNGVASMGKLGIPTIGFGPGDERYAHTVAEQCPVQDLVDAVAWYASFPAEYARGPDAGEAGAGQAGTGKGDV